KSNFDNTNIDGNIIRKT
ncbi:hypothetical protein ACS35_15015, partial [Listeria monocytogenes]|nr:hypothetical protein [Listeria monocytogenes]